MKTMGEIITQRRKDLGMSQAELAAKMNVTDKAVSKWERSLSCPDVNSLSKLAEVLEIPVTELLDAKEQAKPQKEINEIINLILRAIPLAMGVAVMILIILEEIDSKSAFILLGLGLFCLALYTLQDTKK